MKDSKKDIFVAIGKPFCIRWSDPEAGVGEFWFYNKDGKIHCDNECMSTEYVEKIMKALVAQAVMEDKDPRESQTKD